ncbi:MAG TPA: hypothetical protein VHP34_10820 [Alphaproteobacteria bacterium]|jgi:hypothetical protein|nr:hypothetical protein [Alphaproteobacteria bacterium]
MTKSIWNKSFFAALGLAALAVTALHTGAFAESASQRAKEKYKDDPSVMLGNLDGLDYRRTLFAPFGQKTLRLEAPLGMCFLDETNYTERQLMDRVRDAISDELQQQLVAMFVDCLQLTGAARTANGFVFDSGFFSWPVKPGEKVPPTLQEYLAQQKPMEEEAVKGMLDGYIELDIDDPPRESAGGIAVGYNGIFESSHEKIHTVGVAGVTMLQGLPVILGVTHSAKKLQKDKEELYALVDKMLIQQVALNNVR